jgi:hypothetical protein
MAIVGVFTLYFYKVNQQQKRHERVIEHVVCLTCLPSCSPWHRESKEL